MANDSQESPCSSRPRLYPSILTQMQIERLKREDEDEHWISGEELYTEGSSDDEELDREIQIGESESICKIENQQRSDVSKIGENRASNRLMVENSCHSIRTTSNVLNLNEKSKTDHLSSTCTCELTTSATVNPVITNDLSNDRKTSLLFSTITENQTNLIKTEQLQQPSIVESINCSDETVNETVDHFIHDEKKISWRPKRDKNLMFEETIVELRDLQFEYESEILDSLMDLKISLKGTSLNCSSLSLTSVCNDIIIDSRNLRYTNDCSCESDTRIIEDISFNDRDVDRWSNAIINTDKIKNEIVNMVKLDTCIDRLCEKVKKAREETLQYQILNRKKLKKLQRLKPSESGKLAENSTQFYELCNWRNYDNNSMEMEENEDVEILSFGDTDDENLQEIKLTCLPKSINDEKFELESRQSRREKLEERLNLIEKKKLNFIERNKKLAFCAMGTLAITDEEKKRLKELVEELDSSNDEEKGMEKGMNNSAKTSSTSISTPYTIDKDADELLKNLTEQLENINSITYRKSEKEGYAICREEFLPQKEQILLNSLKLLTESKEIEPISEEKIRELINEYYSEKGENLKISFPKDLNDEEINFEDEIKSTSIISEIPTITKAKIEELVEEAKTTMPLFKFKNQMAIIAKPETEDGAQKSKAKLEY